MAGSDNVVLRWNDALLEAVRRSRFGPPITSRALAIVHTCMYDAWAAYDDTAVGMRLADTLRQPVAKRTPANKETAVSFAAYRGAVDVFSGAAAVFDQLMGTLGYDPGDMSQDTTTPVGIGNVASRAVLDFRHHDGSNQLGDVNGGGPYSDYTGYVPVNAPMDMAAPFDPAGARYPNRWQPLRYQDAAGAVVTGAFTTPHWNGVKPFALPSGSWLRASSPRHSGPTPTSGRPSR